MHFQNSEFPMSDGKTYHLETRRGDIANRIITVGDKSRALIIASFLDKTTFAHTSKRNMTTITGTYKDIPVSIVAIGMGVAMVDFFIRETEAIVDGPIAVIRFGSCGSIGSPKIGNVFVAKDGAVLISRDFDAFLDSDKKIGYKFSKLVEADEKLSNHVYMGLI